jgi:hypothetical protein
MISEYLLSSWPVRFERSAEKAFLKLTLFLSEYHTTTYLLKHRTSGKMEEKIHWRGKEKEVALVRLVII